MLENFDVPQWEPGDYRIFQDYLMHRKAFSGSSKYLAIFIPWRRVITEQKENHNKIMNLILES